MSDQSLEAALPAINGRQWHRALDTMRDAPADIIEQKQQVPLEEPIYQVGPRSVVVLEART